MSKPSQQSQQQEARNYATAFFHKHREYIQAREQWQEVIQKQIRTQQWDKIQRFKEPPLHRGYGTYCIDQCLIWEILGCTPFVYETEKALLRLFGDRIRERGWLYQLTSVGFSSASAVEYFLAQDLGDLNRSYDGSTLLERILFSATYPLQTKVRIIHLLLEKGADINIPNEKTGETPLFQCVDRIYHLVHDHVAPEEIIHLAEKRQEYIVLAHCLLHQGADPLLENKHGASALTLMEFVAHGDEVAALLVNMEMRS